MDWKRYNNLGKIDIFNILIRPINEMGSFVHLFSRPVIKSDMGSGPALGMGRGGLSQPKRLSCPPNQNVGKDSVTNFYDLCID